MARAVNGAAAVMFVLYWAVSGLGEPWDLKPYYDDCPQLA
jgi:hypothetical protein